MKAIVICGASLKLEPYAFPYIDELIRQGFDVTVFVWKRDGQEDVRPDDRAKAIYHSELLDDSAPKTKKLGAFMRFRRVVLKELEKSSYDFVVVLDTQFAVLLSDILLKHYKGRFIYDMRDPSYESLGFYRKRVGKIVEASSAVFISSDGYREYLPDNGKIHTTHNIREVDLLHQGIRRNFERSHTPIRISFWGCVRDREINEELIRILANDKRFILQYFGTMSKDSKQLIVYCKERNIKNAVFNGQYLPDERYEFATKTDILHNVYSNSYNGSNPCMGNKYYDGLIFGIPQFCIKGGFMGELIEKHKIGIATELNEGLADRLYDYYTTIDWQKFDTNCETAISDVIEEYRDAMKTLKVIVENAARISGGGLPTSP